MNLSCFLKRSQRNGFGILFTDLCSHIITVLIQVKAALLPSNHCISLSAELPPHVIFESLHSAYVSRPPAFPISHHQQRRQYLLVERSQECRSHINCASLAKLGIRQVELEMRKEEDNFKNAKMYAALRPSSACHASGHSL